MRNIPSPHPILPYVIFVYCAILLIFLGSPISALLSPQLAIVTTEIFVLAGATLAARIFIDQVIIDLSLPSLLPTANSLRERLSIKNSGLTPTSLTLTILTVPVLALFTNLLAAFFAQLPGLADEASIYAKNNAELLPLDNLPILITGIIGIVFAAPFAEEFLFRGTLLPLLRKGHPNLSTHAILVINGCLFSALHVNLFGFVSLFIVGFFFADTVIRSRSILVPITAHACYNLVNGIIFPYIIKILSPDVPLSNAELLEQNSFGLANLALLLGSGLVLLFLWRNLRLITQVQSFYRPHCHEFAKAS